MIQTQPSVLSTGLVEMRSGCGRCGDFVAVSVLTRALLGLLLLRMLPSSSAAAAAAALPATLAEAEAEAEASRVFEPVPRRCSLRCDTAEWNCISTAHAATAECTRPKVMSVQYSVKRQLSVAE